MIPSSVAKGRMIGIVVAAGAIALIMIVVAIKLRLTKGHSVACAVWSSLRRMLFW